MVEKGKTRMRAYRLDRGTSVRITPQGFSQQATFFHSLTELKSDSRHGCRRRAHAAGAVPGGSYEFPVFSL